MASSLTIRFCFLLLFLTGTMHAQHSFTGNFSPAKEYQWALAYCQKSDGKLEYIAESAIVNGNATITLPKDAPIGTYRIIYGIPQDKNYFELLFNGKENVSWSFSSQGISFSGSKENAMISGYFSEMFTLENSVIQYYKSKQKDIEDLKELTLKMKAVQKQFETVSEGLMANNFIQANHPYIPSEEENVFDYIVNAKEHYFEHIDLSNQVLQGSGFLNDKLFNYVFSSLPPKRLTSEEIEKVRQQNVATIHGQMTNVNEAFQLYFYYALWKQASDSTLNSLADFVYENYLKTIAISQKQEGIVQLVEQYNTLRIGATAPDIVGDENTKNLGDLGDVSQYVLVFWSSTCPHCLEQMPQLHENLAGKNNVKVLAVGLEHDPKTWKKESAKLNGFEHALSIGGLQSKTAITYEVKQTPTYYILDDEKKILSKPQNLKEVLEYLN